MYSALKTLSVLALAGTALAIPVADAPTRVERRGGWGEWGWGRPKQGNGDSTPTQPWTKWAATETVYVTADAPAPEEAAATPTDVPAAGGQFFGKPSDAPAPTPAAEYSAPAPEPAAPAPSAPAAPSDGSWEGVVATWRSNLGLSAYTIDSGLTANAQKTADESSGGLKHQLNPGTFAQVLAPGSADDFEHVFVGGWLCELPNTPGLNGVCAEQSNGWDYAGQTGHAEILISSKYTKIGCAHSSGTGVWSCDLS